ncbi:Hypothetical predicted protein [Olea europaea subsp. europaea]|uniref:Uncharacterized protein n=1 Tax=Olea europaea subsp. europaea TaxID=158383 RepID=A0A8S0UQB0_OLEEU|nr:Hypothetical predicted protein [Olea europaea subsp. europaea]
MLWCNLKLPFSKNGKRGKENVNSLVTKSNVDEEYKEAFRTNSFIEICEKVQGQLERKSTDNGTSSSSSSKNVYLSEFLHEPRQETLAYMIENSELHQLLVNYFEISLEASRLCELLLKNVHKVSANYRVIKTTIKQMKQVPDGASRSTDDKCLAVYRNLASLVMLKNPLSTITPLQFHEIHENHSLFLHRLISKCGKAKRRTKVRKCINKIMRYVLVGAWGVLVIPLLILAIHSMIGIVAAPAVLFVLGSLSLYLKKLKVAKKKSKKTPNERLGMQLDIAARGVYILINDFDTISRLVQRLHDELEHEKFLADICVRKGKNEILKEVLREFQIHGSSFLEQLEELEKQIYLCFLDMNRSRRLLFEEMIN